MGIRETLNEKPQIVTGATVAVIALALGYIVFQLTGIGSGGGPSGGSVPTKAYFTADEGNTLIVDDASKLPPIEAGGQQAYRARVYSCDEGKTKFTAVVERVSENAMAELKKLTKPGAGGSGPPPAVQGMIAQQGLEVRQPKQTKWISVRDPAAQALLSPRCPDGNVAQPVYP